MTTSSSLTERLPIWSDSLAGIREIIDQFPVLAQHVGEPKIIRLVLDANILVAEVRWIVKKRRDPKARSSLQEALASGFLVAYAPTYLDEEMRSQLTAVADEEDLSREALFAAWTEYRLALRFYEASGPAAGLPARGFDPKDAPYIETYLAVGAGAIMTSDRHLRTMGAHTVAFELSAKLRTYARDESVDLTLRLGGVVLGTATIASAIGLGKLLINAITSFSRLPAGVQIILVACLVGILLHPPTRQRLAKLVTATGNVLANGLDTFLPIFLQLAEEAGQRRDSAKLMWSQIESQLRPVEVVNCTH